MAKKYDPNKDYSKAIEEAKARGEDTTQLEKERQAKIDDKYGGKEPTMYGSNKTYSQASKDNDKSTISNAVSIANNKSSGGSQPATNNPLTKGPGYVTGGYDLGYYGTPMLQDNPYYKGSTASWGGPDMSRRTDLKNGYAVSNGYTVYYNEDGYATKAVKGAVDYKPEDFVDYYVENGSYNGGNLWTDEEMLTPQDLAAIAAIRAGIGTQYTGDQANQLANQIRAKYGYTIDKSGNVTDSGMTSAIAARRQQLGLPTEPLTDAQKYYAQQMTGGAGSDSALLDALGGMIGIYGEPAEPTVPMLPNIDLSGLGGYGDFGYGGGSGAPEWNGSEWDSVLESLAQQLLGMTYDQWTQGDQYQALANRYGQQGRLSMQDVLGQVSSRTGGLASSWAQTAAQQQYNSFMGDLEKAAMEMYGVEQGDLLDKANLARQYAMDDYNQYVDAWNQWADNRDFAYDAYRDSVADQQYADALALQQAQDQAEMMAAAGDFSGYGALGYTPEQISLLQAAYGAQQTADTATPKKTGGGYDNGSLSNAQVAQLQSLLGVTADGLWGSQSKKAAGGLSAEEAWAVYGSGSGGGDYHLGDGSTSGGKTSLNWDQDEGIFTWNGKNYYDVESLLASIEAANLTPSEMETLKKKFGQYGFNLG